MGSVRITQQLLVSRVLNNLNDQQRRILALQDQLSTGQRVNQPSDDPLAARRAIAAQAEIAKNEQYLTNISNAGPGLTETETALLTVVDILQRANELALQGASGAIDSEQRDQIATEINQLLESMLVQGNQTANGRYLFGGSRTLDAPFVATRDGSGEITAVAYEGNDTKVSIEISEGVRVEVNETGEDVFTQTISGTVDIFQTLIDSRDNLRADDLDALQTRLAELDLAQDQVLVAVSRVGAVQNRLDDTEANLSTISVQLEQVISDNIDADLAEVIVELNAQSNAFQASLSAAARVIQPSLLQFLA
ncbi:MAG: flagellar hook-associated protein FlgL [Candidatus Hydrogenedentes bacterium]|nr:flagellar hook-associated protein FlgL [Candidatus Hydrogenedentota bacterium]MBI3117201.1 flagellar hook-associated protein FlgL [Candidatus Hydrogenedentota bacterium]